MRPRLRAAGAALSALWLLAGCGRGAPAPAADGAGDPWPAFTQVFLESYLRANPFFAVQSGRHEFDGQMPDLSASAIAARMALLRQWRAAAAALDAAALSPSERLEREHQFTVIDSELYWVERARRPFTSPSWYLDQLDPDVYLNRSYAPAARRLQGYLGYVRSIPKIAQAIRANLATPLPPSFVQRGIDGFGGFASFYRHDAAAAFAEVSDPSAQRELAAANEAAARAMEALKSWLEGERAHATGDFALGRERFLEMLKVTERLEVPLPRLIELGEADLEKNTAALAAACGAYLPHGTLDACVKKMNAHKSPGGALEGARVQLAQLRAFIVANGLLTVPGTEQPRVTEAPSYARANSAYSNIPGPYEQGVGYQYVISPPDPRWSASERLAYIPGAANLLYGSVHEVWPGHFLQFLTSNHNPSKIDALWVGYAYSEGWAHYGEQLMWDAGLGGGDPEQHVGQLVNALERNVRYLAAIGLHTGGMSEAAAERMFRERAFLDPGDARQQAARGTYDPQYLNYTLGKLMVLKLRADWVAQQQRAGGSAEARSYWREFHDRLLAHTGPLPLIRAALLGEAGEPL